MNYELNKKIFLFKKIARKIFAQVAQSVPDQQKIEKDLKELEVKVPKLKEYFDKYLDRDSSKLKDSIKALQKQFKLPQTGEIDERLGMEIEWFLQDQELERMFPKERIKELQSLMQTIPTFAKILAPFGVDGIWGPRTNEAIIQLEKFLGLKVSGVPKESTVEKLREYLTFGGLSASQFESVQRLMMQIPDLSKIVQVADGKWGPKSTAAMKEFQHSVGLSPSGYPDKESIKALEKAVEDRKKPEKQKDSTTISKLDQPKDSTSYIDPSDPRLMQLKNSGKEIAESAAKAPGPSYKGPAKGPGPEGPPTPME